MTKIKLRRLKRDTKKMIKSLEKYYEKIFDYLQENDMKNIRIGEIGELIEIIFVLNHQLLEHYGGNQFE
jgi:hypothetical protein